MVSSFIKKQDKLVRILIIALLATAIGILSVTGTIDLFNSGSFFAGIGILINLTIFVALLGGLLATYLFKKTKLVKILGTILLTYWVIATILNTGSPLFNLNGGIGFFAILSGIFLTTANVAVLGVVVFYVLKMLLKKDLSMISEILLLVIIGCSVIGFTFDFLDAIFNGFDFANVLLNVIDLLIFPVLAVIGYVLLLNNKSTE